MPLFGVEVFGGVANVENRGGDRGCGEAVAGVGMGVEDKVAGGVVVLRGLGVGLGVWKMLWGRC